MTVAIADRGPEVAGLASFFLAATTISIALRCYCRMFLVKNFGSDDWAAVAAWAMFVLFCTFAILGCLHGTGQHATNLPPAEIPIGLKWWWFCEPFYVLSNMALKFSIGVFLMRLAVARVHRIIIILVMVVIEVYGTFYFVIFIVQCQPSNYFWTQYTGGKGVCLDTSVPINATYVYSAISCVADWTLALIPVFMIWNLQMNPRTKVSVGLILAMGGIASTATIVRIPYVKALGDRSDFLYATTDVAIWSTIETGIGITASAVATLRPLFRTFLSRSRLMGNSSNSDPVVSSGLWAPSKKGGGPPGNNGYIRSQGEQFGLRSNLKGSITTVIESNADARGPERKGSLVRKETGQTRGGATRMAWNDSESRLTEVSSDEEDKGYIQIRKSTVQETQIKD